MRAISECECVSVIFVSLYPKDILIYPFQFCTCKSTGLRAIRCENVVPVKWNIDFLCITEWGYVTVYRMPQTYFLITVTITSDLSLLVNCSLIIIFNNICQITGFIIIFVKFTTVEIQVKISGLQNTANCQKAAREGEKNVHEWKNELSKSKSWKKALMEEISRNKSWDLKITFRYSNQVWIERIRVQSYKI